MRDTTDRPGTDRLLPPLHGRAAELDRLDRLLAQARAGASAALVLRGEAGIGKSALLMRAAATATGMRVLRLTGVETEAELPFAALHALVAAADPDWDALPPNQADALRTALGLVAGPPPDRLLVGLATLGLLAELSAARPVLCVIDDAHWIDRASAQVLLFAARRLRTESVAVLFTARTGLAPEFRAPGIAEHELPRLDDTAARELLGTVAGDLPRPVRDQLLREAAGNPLALHELPAAHRAGRAPAYPLGPPQAGRGGIGPTHSAVEREFAARIAALPVPARTVLLVAAADGTCDTAVVLAAAGRLGAGAGEVDVLERERLLMFADGCMGFQHPLIRTAVYGGATLTAKRTAHAALATVLADRGEDDRRNWHLAAASLGPNPEVAAALEHSAERARERGSHEAVAAAYDRAAELTAHGPQRVHRRITAAEAAAEVGHRSWVRHLIGRELPGALEPAQRARVALLRARLAEEEAEPEQTHRLLLDAVGPTARDAPELAGEMLLWAVDAAWAARDATLVERVRTVAQGLALPAVLDPVLAHVTLALAQLGEQPAAAPPARAALALIARCAPDAPPRVAANIAGWHLVAGADRTALALAEAADRRSRETGTPGALPRVLAALAGSRWYLGHWTAAATAADEGLRIAHDIGQEQAVDLLAGVQANLAAARGDEAGLAAALAEFVGRRPTPRAAGIADSARGLLDLGRGRFDAAADRLAAGASHAGWRRELPDLVEAAVRAGQPEPARAAADRFARWAAHSGQPWARALVLRNRALVEPDADVERLFAEAVGWYREDGAHPFDRARTELLQGEWLRRARRRRGARGPLRAAAATFHELGAQPWAERARAELRATGETRAVHPAAAAGVAELTPQELQVVRLAATGLSNRDIGAQLFLSPRTVGYHLYKAFPKLGVASRAQLVRFDIPA